MDWNEYKNNPEYAKKLEKAASAECTPLGIYRQAPYAVFSGRHGIYETTLEFCDCESFFPSSPCKHMLRLAMEVGLLDCKTVWDKSAVKFPTESDVVFKTVYIDTNTGKTYDKRPTVKGKNLSGLSIVLTGDFEIPRSELVNLIWENGGAYKSSVSSRTDYVVVGDNPGSKFTKAQELGIPVITLDQLQGMIDYGEKA